MIPKKIHYIWLGNNPLPDIAVQCIESWKKFCPDYEIIRWDETNLELDKYQFASDAYKAGEYAFASDVFRFDILKSEGGIYLDIDVELYKPLDDFLTNDFFTGFENKLYVAPGLVMGATANHPFLDSMLEIYSRETFDNENLKTVCVLATDYLEERYNLKCNGKTQKLSDGITVYAPAYFCPKDSLTHKIKMTKNTYSIHHYYGSWTKPNSKWFIFQARCKRFCKRLVGKKLYAKIKKTLGRG